MPVDERGHVYYMVHDTWDRYHLVVLQCNERIIDLNIDGDYLGRDGNLYSLSNEHPDGAYYRYRDVSPTILAYSDELNANTYDLVDVPPRLPPIAALSENIHFGFGLDGIAYDMVTDDNAIFRYYVRSTKIDVFYGNGDGYAIINIDGTASIKFQPVALLLAAVRAWHDSNGYRGHGLRRPNITTT